MDEKYSPLENLKHCLKTYEGTGECIDWQEGMRAGIKALEQIDKIKCVRCNSKVILSPICEECNKIIDTKMKRVGAKEELEFCLNLIFMD